MNQDLPFTGNPDEILAFWGLGIFMIVMLLALVTIAIHVLICWLISSALSAVPEEHREMEPGLVWLLLIPCFSIIWNFFVFPKVSRSMNIECE